MSPSAWADAANALGLTLFPPGLFSESRPFPALLRAMAIGDGDRSSPWMYGQWPREGGQRRHEVLVLVDVRPEHDWQWAETHVLVRLQTPLLYGVDLFSRRWFQQSFTPQPPIGHPGFDASFVFCALDPAQTLRLLTPEVVDALLPFAADFVHVTDTAVDLRTPDGAPRDAGALAIRLERAVALAEALSFRRRAIRPTEAERRATDVWAEVAAAEGLGFERFSRQMEGQVGSLSVTLSMEGAPRKLRTVVHAKLPRRLGAGLRLFEQQGISAIASLFGRQDIQIGDPAFDAAFVVQGHEPQVRAILADARLRAALHTLLVGSDAFIFDDASLVLSYPYVIDRADVLRATISTTREIAALVFGPRGGPPQGVGPYR